MDSNRMKYAAQWLYGKVFQDEPIQHRTAPKTERVPSLICTARSLENNLGNNWQSRESIFLKQAKLLANYEDDHEFHDNVVRYFPTYQSLTDRELRGYFTWRTKLRKGDIQKTSLSFAFLYIYEQINQIGVSDPMDRYQKLIAFRVSYGKLDDGILPYLDRWLGERDAKCINNFFWSQPALNYGYAHPNPDKPWELPVDHPDCVAMKQELMKIIDFWMDLGTDAFRVDMAQSLIKGDTDGSCLQQFWHEIRTHMERRNPECLLIAEWGAPSEAIQAGFHLDFLLHSGPTAYRSLFRYEKGRNTFLGVSGHSYFHKDGLGNINEYLDRFLHDMENIQGHGNIGLITGNHDMQRLAYGRTPEEIKVAMVFLFTMPGVPFVYYGDEIGMDYIEGLPSKEGGYIRTGSRTPMQWNSNKNHGFSESNAPYLPTDTRDGAPTVENQEQDSESILSFVKQLIALHKKDPRLWANADFHIQLASYPFVYERIKDNTKLLIAINPSEARRYYDIPSLSTVYLSQNVSVEEDRLVMNGISFIIAEEAIT